MTDDRKCDLGSACACVERGSDGYHWKGREVCPHFHMPMPRIGNPLHRSTKFTDLRDQGNERQMKTMGSYDEHRRKIKRATGKF